MAGYVLFVPGRSVGSVPLLQELGLGSLCSECGPDWWIGQGPPGQGQGLLCGWMGLGGDDAPIAADVERTWQPLAGHEQLGRDEGAVWLGTEVRRPLIPRDIARPSFVPGGQFVRLADGHDWYVPIAAQLPCRGKLNPAGQLEQVLLPRFAELHARSKQYYLALLEDLGKTADPQAEFQVTWSEGYTFCWDALQLNYRVTPEILDVLGVLDNSAAGRLISTVICKADITEFAFKKKETSLGIPIF